MDTPIQDDPTRNHCVRTAIYRPHWHIVIKFFFFLILGGNRNVTVIIKLGYSVLIVRLFLRCNVVFKLCDFWKPSHAWSSDKLRMMVSHILSAVLTSTASCVGSRQWPFVNDVVENADLRCCVLFRATPYRWQQSIDLLPNPNQCSFIEIQCK